MWYDVQREVGRYEMGRASDLGTAVLRHPDTQSLHQMWEALRGDRPVPFRAELDAQKIGAKAPFLAILEYVGPSNFRIRIAGDRLNKWFGMELRGMSALALLDTAARNHFQATLNRVTADPSVAVLHGSARGLDGYCCGFEMILLPMRSDFGKVDRVLVGLWLLEAPLLTRGPLRLEPDRFTVAPITEGAVEEMSLAEAETGLRRPVVSLRAVDGSADLAVPAAEVGGSPTPDDTPPEPGRRGHLRLVKKS
jgi:hypothetical protein